MEEETTYLYDDNLGLDKTTLKFMNLEDLFDLRHDLLRLKYHLEKILNS